ncbi:hypothetical protein [Lyngbya aestuarii]|uniref:hypothetical protein n=1 Tax=Lyngbya aestuarii TaxID=118322 RepID=UPI00403DA2C7
MAIWRIYLTDSQQKMKSITEPQGLLREGTQATRNFARSHSALYKVMGLKPRAFSAALFNCAILTLSKSA